MKPFDLQAPKTKKVKLWVNVYRTITGGFRMGSPFESGEEAVRYGDEDSLAVAEVTFEVAG